MIESSISFQHARELHHQWLMGSFISNVSKTSKGFFVQSDLITDSFWNYLYSPQITASFDSEVADEFRKVGRAPCILADTETSSVVREYLAIRSTKAFDDSWMCYVGSHVHKSAPLPSAALIRKCEEFSDFSGYLQVFFAAYAGNDPKEPYGALPPAYGVAFEQAFALRHQRNLEFWLLMWDAEPVGCAMTARSGSYAGLYGLGTKPSHRGRGVARLLTEFGIKRAYDEGAEFIFLQTEAGSYNERLYRAYGFETFARSEGFVLT